MDAAGGCCTSATAAGCQHQLRLLPGGPGGRLAGSVGGAGVRPRVPGEKVGLFVSALVGPRFGPELFGSLLPNAGYRYYGERDVIFARAGIYRPARRGGGRLPPAPPPGACAPTMAGRLSWAGGARCWAMKAAPTRPGCLGCALPCGLLRGAKRPPAWWRRSASTLGSSRRPSSHELVRLAYQKPLSRAEIAALAVLVTRLAAQGDALASRIMAKVAGDLAALALHAARRLFSPERLFRWPRPAGCSRPGQFSSNPWKAAWRENSHVPALSLHQSRL